MAAGRPLGRPLAAIAIALVLAALAATLPSPALAYDNLTAHPKINSEAVKRYEERARLEEWLARTALSGRATIGPAVTEVGLLQIREQDREMTVAEWLSHGGMSADEPELPASFRHFFDPLKSGGTRHLTDHIDDVLEWSLGLGELAIKGAGWIIPLVDTENPKVDARVWALSHADNRYNYEMAIEYYRAALAKVAQLDANRQPTGANPDYGKAWRAVGETMHMIADMTVPAHVRNDSHPYVPYQGLKLGNPDPYESTISGADISAFAGGAPSTSIDYTEPDLFDLFEAVALWTNANFYSLDTIQKRYVMGLTGPTENGNPEYPSPPTPSSDSLKGGYYHRDIDGQPVPILGTSLLRRLVLIPGAVPLPYGVLDWTVLQAQRRLLIPTAIEASSRVLECFLPRFKAETAVEQLAAGKYLIQGQLVHKPTLAWPSAPEVNNGMFLKYTPAGSNQAQAVWLSESDFRSGNHPVGNRIELEFEAQAGAVISVCWDLGGYVITSEPKALSSADLIVLPERLGDIWDGDEVSLEAIATWLPPRQSAVGLEWSFGDDKEPQTANCAVTAREASHHVTHIYDRPGTYRLNVRVINRSNGDVIAQVTRSIEVKQKKITVQIYPRGLTGRPGVPLEASSLPSESRYRYEWTFGDGQTLTDGKSVVQHAWEKAGAYDLTLRLFLAGASASAPPLAEDSIKVDIRGYESECPLCGHVHGELKQVVTKGAVYYQEDGTNRRQCLYASFYDEGHTIPRDTGVFVDDKREGVWTTDYETGVRQIETPYRAGLVQGVVRGYTRTGALLYEYEYRDGEKDGMSIDWWTGWQSEFLPGEVHKLHEGPLVFRSEPRGSVRHGYWTEWWTAPKLIIKSEGSYNMGEQEGPWREYHPDGQLKEEGAYLHAKRTGVWVSWAYLNGTKTKWTEGPYVEGKRHGTWYEYIGSGEYWIGDYVNGVKKGVWTWYRADGSVVTTRTH